MPHLHLHYALSNKFLVRWPPSMHAINVNAWWSSHHRILSIGPSRRESQGNVGRNGVYKSVECRWVGGYRGLVTQERFEEWSGSGFDEYAVFGVLLREILEIGFYFDSFLCFFEIMQVQQLRQSVICRSDKKLFIHWVLSRLKSFYSLLPSVDEECRLNISN